MSLEQMTKEQLVLRIDQELRYQLDEIIQRLQKLAKEYNIGQKADKRSPLRNILITSTDRTASVEVIKNQIRYQIGRKEGSEVWKIERNGVKFGEVIAQQLDALSQDAIEILKRIQETLPKDSLLQTYLNPKQLHREEVDLHLKLAQLYLGYLVREHTAQANSGNFSSNHSDQARSSEPSRTSQNPATQRPSRPNRPNRH
jgi:hypothetical protein